LSGEAAQSLECHAWKGNVRELQHVLERASILIENGDTVRTKHLFFPFELCSLQPASHNSSCAGLAS
jgi:transcriptional regulator with PAS, ATPase and Fis domain